MAATQSFKSHARFDPVFHFCIIPLLLLNLIFSIYVTVHTWPAYEHTHLWWIVMAFVFILMAVRARQSALKAQDRVIRLEERLRLAALLPAGELGSMEQLSMGQLIALRFASDTELPALVRRTLSEKLGPKAIKESIVNWRADHYRV
ncbi:MAG: DUF6526 family protein [Acidobacteriota bacterium]|nr:DUF6526 family protein [Acidobacteriota bacterium]